MSSGPRNVTSTTTTEIPEFLRTPLNRATVSATDQAANVRNNVNRAGGPTMDEMQAQGLIDLFNRGQQGSPLTDAAGDLTGATLRGDFLSSDSNPFLQQTFDRAAELTRGRLDSEFAGAGRNLGAAMPARSEELQTLASNIFGGNFQRERDRQANAVGQAQNLANQDFTNIRAMLDAGGFNIDQFINRLGTLIPGAGGTTRSTQPVFRTGLF